MARPDVCFGFLQTVLCVRVGTGQPAGMTASTDAYSSMTVVDMESSGFRREFTFVPDGQCVSLSIRSTSDLAKSYAMMDARTRTQSLLCEILQNCCDWFVGQLPQWERHPLRDVPEAVKVDLLKRTVVASSLDGSELQICVDRDGAWVVLG